MVYVSGSKRPSLLAGQLGVLPACRVESDDDDDDDDDDVAGRAVGRAEVAPSR